MSMDNETAKALVSWISNALNTAMSAHLRLAALEDLLKEKDAELYATYQKRVESLANHRAVEMNALSLEGLRAKLARQ